ncbi:MAG TPA: ABC transporter permease [Chthonomonas sp.]|jgi:peptide/nickel transport system permease protein|uniref:ABC transporter permease n=1 Tax=Chthonomonas sp. TaxID=2282153 RepID=UPI002B4AB4D9|nr:ABC transporter permease [Chthonomonas sp.]HLH80728.1 ABC transporter permease [Chthonomonas sp.]
MYDWLSWDNLVPFLVVSGLVVAIRLASRQPLWREAFRRLRRNRAAIVAVCVIGLYGLVAFLDSISWKSSVNAEPKTVLDRIFEAAHVRVERTYSAPFAKYTMGEVHPHRLRGLHLLGTDGTGNDVLYKTLKGCRTALLIGGLSSLLVLPLAVILGMLAGYFGKIVDDIIQYIYTVVGSVPDILLIIALVLVLGRGVVNICIALAFTSWIGLCRLVRGETLKYRDREFVLAARALGASNVRILMKHILPNLLPVVIISMVLGFSGFVLYEPLLAYLGVGVGPDVGSWGNMIDAARIELTRTPVIWWNLASASGALFILVLAFNILGDALRDAIDPRLRSS